MMVWSAWLSSRVRQNNVQFVFVLGCVAGSLVVGGKRFYGKVVVELIMKIMITLLLRNQ